MLKKIPGYAPSMRQIKRWIGTKPTEQRGSLRFAVMLGWNLACKAVQKEERKAEEMAGALKRFGIEPPDLDELVHDACSAEASATNNQGLEDQCEVLIRNGYTISQIAAQVVEDKEEDQS